jgi:hypothetical protein
MDELPTNELIRRIEKMEADWEAKREEDKKKRHGANNAFGKSMLRMSDDIMRHEEAMMSIPALVEKVVDLDHLIRGVDGENGMRSDVKAIKETQASMKTQVAILSAGFAMGGTLAMQWIISLFKG